MSVAIKHPAVAAIAPAVFRAPMAFGDDADTDDLELETEVEDDPELEEDSPEFAAAEEAKAAAVEAKAIERQARAQGWRPEAEFSGEGKWVDAATFVQRGTQHKKKLEQQVAALTAGLEEQKKTNEAFAKFHKEAMERKTSELDAAIKAARLDHKEAIRNGEDDDALNLEDRIDALKEEKAKLKEAPAQKEGAKETEAAAANPDTTNPLITAWINDGNEWFRDDPKLNAYAMIVGDELRAEGNTLRDRAFLDAVRARMEEDFPAKFAKGNPLRSKAGAVSSGTSGAQQAQGRSERDLPKEDRALMNKFVADGLMTKEAFLKDYNWS